MAFKLPPAIYSPELLESVIYELEQYLDWYRQSHIQKEVGAKATPEPAYSAETVLVTEAWLDGKKPTTESLERLIKTLQDYKPPVIHVTLAALPNHEQRAQLVDWFRANAAPEALLSFVADRTLGGGVVVRTPGRIFDWSWRQRLLEGRAKLAGIVRHV